MELLAPLLTTKFALAVVATLLGGFTFGFTGFGGSVLMTPLLALLYWPIEGVILAAFVPAIMGAVGWPGVLPYVRWREVTPLLITGVIAAPIGVFFLVIGDPGPIRRFMGITVLVFAVLMMFGWRYRGTRNRATSVLSGAISGFLNGYAGLAGTWLSLYFLSAPEESRVKRANLYISAMTMSLLTLIPLVVGGYAGRDTWVRGIALLLPYALAIQVGGRLFAISSDRSYQRVAIWLLLAIGIYVTMA